MCLAVPLGSRCRTRLDRRAHSRHLSIRLDSCICRWFRRTRLDLHRSVVVRPSTSLFVSVGVAFVLLPWAIPPPAARSTTRKCGTTSFLSTSASGAILASSLPSLHASLPPPSSAEETSMADRSPLHVCVFDGVVSKERWRSEPSEPRGPPLLVDTRNRTPFATIETPTNLPGGGEHGGGRAPPRYKLDGGQIQRNGRPLVR